MGKYFSEDVENALAYIYYDMRNGKAKGKEGFALLKKAAAKDDGDAQYVLSRCLLGYQYVWAYHEFEEDEETSEKLARQSVLSGSAIGVIGSLRSRFLTPELIKEMPFDNVKEAFNIVMQKAQEGEAFCQYLIGNTYFWGDILTIDEIEPNSFPNPTAFQEYLGENAKKAELWLLQAYRNGIYSAGGNLTKLYEDGDGEFFPPQPQKVSEIIKMGAEYGYPNYQKFYGDQLIKENRLEEAHVWYVKSANNGQNGAWYLVVQGYYEGKGVPQDIPKALEACMKGIEKDGVTGCYNIAGEIYYLGKENCPQDYMQAVKYFEIANKQGNDYGNDMLADCYLNELGCIKDSKRAFELISQCKYKNSLTNYIKGICYTEGLGVKEDIKQGVEYLKASQDPRAVVALTKYKKGLFGGWSRR